LKVQASNYCKDRAVEDLLYSAAQLGVPFKNVEAIKKRWKECKMQAELETMGGVIQQMKKEFRFATINDKEWKVQTKMDFMREYKLVYLNELGKKVLGCVARQAGDKVHDRFEPLSQSCWSDKTQMYLVKACT
jgi:hypothetical protein